MSDDIAMGLDLGDFLAFVGPEIELSVLGASYDLPVLETANRGGELMPLKGLDTLQGVHVSDLRGGVPGARNQSLAVFAEA